MFVLERRVFQGTEVCPQYRWVQYALCGNRSLLERVRSAQRRSENWRVAALATLDSKVERNFRYDAHQREDRKAS